MDCKFCSVGDSSLGNTFVVTHSCLSDAGKGWQLAPLPAGAMVWGETECHSKNRQNVAPALELCRGDGQQNPQPPLSVRLSAGLLPYILVLVIHLPVLCVDLFPSVWTEGLLCTCQALFATYTDHFCGLECLSP